MKFFLMRGNGANDGVVSFGDNEYTYTKLDFSEDIDEQFWSIRYDDEVIPAINDAELSTMHHRPLDQEEINTLGVLAERLYNEAKDADDALRAEEQRLDDEKFFGPYKTWSLQSKKSRDGLLSSSDPYILLSNLDDTGWEEWRQWVRDLPQTYDAPMKISSWIEPPTNANNIVVSAYNTFKRRCETSNNLFNHYNS